MNAPAFSIEPPVILPVSSEKTTSGRNNAKGHLFERFMGRVFEAYGCAPPTRERLNLRSAGIELDISTEFVLTKEKAIAECKAYSSNVEAALLSQFYGKLTAERFSNDKLHGWFVALPGLTKDGLEFAKKLEASDARFRYVSGTTIAELIGQRGWVPTSPSDIGPHSDAAIVISEEGLFGAAKLLDQDTRLPISILVWGSEGYPPSKATLQGIEASNYSAGLPVQALASSPSPRQPERQKPTLVEVTGSTSDFEYQFPASPAFFVGRKDILRSFGDLFDDQAQPRRSLVLNAQSGWGKSSLALSLGELVRKKHGYAIVLDARTASGPEYVSAALREGLVAASGQGLLELPDDRAFGSIQSSLATAKRAKWKSPGGPLLIFFDQFENVFRDARLTQEFRDLALSLARFEPRLYVGFAWKTDLVGWTEKHPYHLRDEIRGASIVQPVRPFGPKEVGTIITRLGKAAGRKVSPDLRRRIGEYSQGLPWLLKKLSNHLLHELLAGISEDELLDESLNIQALFDRDLAELQPEEVEALRNIARVAPVPVSETIERTPASLIQSLVDKRLIVRVGENLDVYWDIFRDFLNTGRVAIEETYILRQRTASSGRILREVIAAGGDVEVEAVANSLKTSVNVVFNGARDLRQLGVLSPASRRLKLSPSISTTASDEEFRRRVGRAVRRHRAFGLAEAAAANQAGRLSLEEFAELLPTAFPAVQGEKSTWKNYAINFAEWFDYSGMATLRGQVLIFVGTHHPKRTLLRAAKRKGPGSRSVVFPNAGPNHTLQYAQHLLGYRPSHNLDQRALHKAQGNLIGLSLVDEAGAPKTELRALFTDSGELKPDALAALLASHPTTKLAFQTLSGNPKANGSDLGTILKDRQGMTWGPATVRSYGNYFRSWGRAAGLRVRNPRSKDPV